MPEDTKFCVALDKGVLEKAKREAVNRGVDFDIATKTGPFLRYLLEEYLTQDSPAKKK